MGSDNSRVGLLLARCRAGELGTAAIARAARLGDAAAMSVSPNTPRAADLDDVLQDVRRERHEWTDRQSCVRLAIAAVRFAMNVCRALLPPLEGSAARSALAAAEAWCLSPSEDTARAAKEVGRTVSLLIRKHPGIDLWLAVVGAAGSVADAPATEETPAWRRAIAAAISEAISSSVFHVMRTLREDLGRPATEEEKESRANQLDGAMLDEVRDEVVPWLLGDYDPLGDRRD